MRPADRPWAETDADRVGDLTAGREYPARSDDLAERLMRLPVGHPSAGADEPAGDEPGANGLDDGWGEIDQSKSDLGDDLGQDDTGCGDDTGSGDAGGAAAARARQPRPAPDTSAWGERVGPSARTPYRPWFGADGASDPWFAAGPIE
jgi:hypothetical protein